MLSPVRTLQNCIKPALVAALLSSCAGCFTTPVHSSSPAAASANDAAFALPTHLVATMTNNDVVLNWQNNATTDGGVWVEYTTPGSDYIQLDALGSDSGETSFLHPNVSPQTTLLYRLRPFFGKATKAVEITTGPAATGDSPGLPMGPIDPTNNVASDRWQKFSIRQTATLAQAMPSDLIAKLSASTSVELRWKDRSSDEDGFLLEISARDGDYVPCALLPPDTTSFRKTGLPAETKCYFRVRAFFNGPPVGPVSVTTP